MVPDPKRLRTGLSRCGLILLAICCWGCRLSLASAATLVNSEQPRALTFWEQSKWQIAAIVALVVSANLIDRRSLAGTSPEKGCRALTC